MITIQNYEEYLMLFIDDELDAVAVAELMDFLADHPELKKELEIYQKTKLHVEEAAGFVNKEQLLKKQGIVLDFRRWLLYGAAAGIALLIGFNVLRWRNNPTVTSTTEPSSVAQKKAPAVIPSISEIQQKKAPVFPAPAPTSPPASTPSTLSLAKNKSLHPVSSKPTPVNPLSQSTQAPQNPVTPENKELPIAQTAEPPVTPVTQDPPVQPEHPVTTEKQTSKKKGLFAKLHFSSEKKDGFNHLKNTVEEKVETVKNINESLKNTSFGFKIGDKELLVINL
ncbi:MAG TPA: hypothetical protein VL098_10480 [Flavipsychrobacter sp.]|nr:hypothetical protein [Flavipsychrobacter sp.]